MVGSRKVASNFVVAGCDTAPILEAAEEVVGFVTFAMMVVIRQRANAAPPKERRFVFG